MGVGWSRCLPPSDVLSRYRPRRCAGLIARRRPGRGGTGPDGARHFATHRVTPDGAGLFARRRRSGRGGAVVAAPGGEGGREDPDTGGGPATGPAAGHVDDVSP